LFYFVTKANLPPVFLVLSLDYQNLKRRHYFIFYLFFMKDFTTYLSTAPVVGTVWFIFTAGLIIEINRFFPDPLIFSF
jgi:photosystem I subunit 9